MRWPIFAIFAYFALTLEVGLRAAMNNPLGLSVGTPSLLMVLMVYIALAAPSSTAMGSAIVLGLLADLTHVYPMRDRLADATILGPHAVGFALGAFAAVYIKPVVMRQSLWALPMVVFVAGLMAQLVIVLLLTLRGVGVLHSTPLDDWHVFDQLYTRFLSLLYTCVLAIPLGKVLLQTDALWGFSLPHRSRRGA
ncbi:MAG: rod shape-determining protein MreD [Phycisphaera sp.]|nr:rod shape-determining protein MreD [Phycisphaera sp.]